MANKPLYIYTDSYWAEYVSANFCLFHLGLNVDSDVLEASHTLKYLDPYIMQEGSGHDLLRYSTVMSGRADLGFSLPEVQSLIGKLLSPRGPLPEWRVLKGEVRFGYEPRIAPPGAVWVGENEPPEGLFEKWEVVESPSSPGAIRSVENFIGAVWEEFSLD